MEEERGRGRECGGMKRNDADSRYALELSGLPAAVARNQIGYVYYRTAARERDFAYSSARLSYYI